MATVSMHAGENAFGNMTLQLSPAFRSVNQRALRGRKANQTDLQKLSELARSDEFSDDESDGVDSDDEPQDDEEIEEIVDTFEDRRPVAHAALVMTPRRHSPYHRAQTNSAHAAASATNTIDLDDDDLIDVKETMYVPYRQPPRSDRSPRMDRFMQKRIAQQQRRHFQDASPSPKVRPISHRPYAET